MFVDGAIEEDTLFKSGHFMNDLEMFTPKTSAFESLKSLGLNIIKNDSLRKDIITLYQITLPDLNDPEEQKERDRLRIVVINDLHNYLQVDYISIVRGKANGLKAIAPDLRYLKLKNIENLHKEDLLIMNIQQSLMWTWIISKQHLKAAEEIERILTNIKSELSNK